MTGTAATEAEEFYKIYSLETIVIPTNKPNVRKDYNDLIYRTEEDKFKAVIKDTKQRHQAGQPVLIGTISIEKNEVVAAMMEREGLHPEMLNAKNHQKEAEIISRAGRLGAITLATNMAGRGVDIILGAEDKEEQEKVKSLGGLHVIGTERHESRRIDNQLRGRAARQGDPGSSQFYVSTEDDLMRIFGGDRMKSMMNTLRVPADMPIENKMVSKSLESAQKKVEGNNFDMRKHLVEYDDVINKHREAIYRRRREILEIAEGEKSDKTLSEIIRGMLREEIALLVDFHCQAEQPQDWNVAEIAETIGSMVGSDPSVAGKLGEIAVEVNKQAKEEIIAYLNGYIDEKYEEITQAFAGINVKFQEVEKGILIRSIDQLWVEHLETMDYMRRGIGLRGYGQHDPLVEYKKEAYRMFHELNDLIRKQVAYSIFKTADAIDVAPAEILKLAQEDENKQLSFEGAKKTMGESAGTIDIVHEKAKDEEGNKVGRNDPCPCGSGKKYKKCHGK